MKNKKQLIQNYNLPPFVHEKNRVLAISYSGKFYSINRSINSLIPPYKIHRYLYLKYHQ